MAFSRILSKRINNPGASQQIMSASNVVRCFFICQKGDDFSGKTDGCPQSVAGDDIAVYDGGLG